jgi:hypothetical protein
MLKLPITEQSKQQEWKIILTIAQNNGFPMHIIHGLKKNTDNQKTQTKTKTGSYKNTTKHLPQSTNKKDY